MKSISERARKEKKTINGTPISVYKGPPNIQSESTPHLLLAVKALNAFHNGHRSPPDEYTMTDLIWALGLVADGRGLDFLDIVKEAVCHWYIERAIPGINDIVDVSIDIGEPY